MFCSFVPPFFFCLIFVFSVIQIQTPMFNLNADTMLTTNFQNEIVMGSFPRIIIITSLVWLFQVCPWKTFFRGVRIFTIKLIV
ncbi:hypothetical protein BC941DRAFT_413178 [Chlamydoabsidia padenii]|nr:hypothetical protein BC941DRAFT_413178 [Chlamydoabsidia padenii]